MRARTWCLLFALTFSTAASAYWGRNHETLNLHVSTTGELLDGKLTRGSRPIKGLNDYLIGVYYINGDSEVSTVLCDVTALADRPDDPPDSPPGTFAAWVGYGGVAEDAFVKRGEAVKWGGRRAVNHFHDPIGPGGYTGILDNDEISNIAFINLLGKGISAADWVMNGRNGNKGVQNYWGYPTVGISFHRAFTAPTLGSRQSALAAAFRAIGQVMHLIEDNTVPDHTRDLAHPGSGFEEYMEEHRAASFGDIEKPWKTFPLKHVETGGLRAFWDRDVYASDPMVLSSTEPGISEYVNGNFLAWNALSLGPFLRTFSTIPSRPGAPFQGTSASGEPPAGVIYHWPRLGPLDEGCYPSEPGTLRFLRSACEGKYTLGGEGGIEVRDIKLLNEKAWARYVKPLMSLAHGYAESFLGLVLPPVRAELVPGASFLTYRVRLWNLGTPGSDDALTWHLDSLKLQPMVDDDLEVTANGLPLVGLFGNVKFSKAPVEIAATGVVTAGAAWESPDFKLTLQQQFTLAYSRYSAVLVTAHLGTTKTTPLVFSVPIPNTYVVVQQTEAVDQTVKAQNTRLDCCSSCGTCGEQGSFGVSRHQTAKGSVRGFAPQLDLFGAPASEDVKKALQEDARIAAIGLVAFPRERQDLTQPVVPTGSSFALTGDGAARFVRAGPFLFVRDIAAPDAADEGAVGFDADLQLAQLYAPATFETVDMLRASSSVYVAVWTTSGALYLQQLRLWPAYTTAPAAQLTSGSQCTAAPNSRTATASYDTQQWCGVSFPSGTCAEATFKARSSAVVWAPNGSISPANFTDSVYLGLAYGTTLATQVAGKAVPADANGLTLKACDPAALESFAAGFDTSTSGVCAAANGVVAYDAVAAQGLGACNLLAPRTLPRTATYKRVFQFENENLTSKVFGLLPPPPEFTFTLR